MSPTPKQTDSVAETAFRQVSKALVSKWLAEARPNARIVYGHGVHLAEACNPEMGEWMREVVSRRGFVTLHQVRAGRSFDYIAVRTHKPFPKGLAL